MQEDKLRELLTYLNVNSPFYKRLFSENSLDIAKIQSLKDLSKLPTTNKEDLQKFNMDFLCVSKDKIIEYTSTSGTLGSPVTIRLQKMI